MNDENYNTYHIVILDNSAIAPNGYESTGVYIRATNATEALAWFFQTEKTYFFKEFYQDFDAVQVPDIWLLEDLEALQQRPWTEEDEERLYA